MLGRLKERLPAERRERFALGALLAVLVAGGALRLWLMVSIRPALFGYADSYAYVAAAKGPLFGDPLRPVGYSVFLSLLHAVNANLSFTTLAQHALGLASAVLLYLAARRVGVSRWWSLLPAAVVALAGPQVLLEHAPLTEALFILLQSAAVYAAARAVGRRDWAWALAAGALAGTGATVRALGLLLVAAFALCLLATPADGWRRRLGRAGAALAAAFLVVGAYVVAQEQETGYRGLAPAGGWNLYGRVAPFADCDRFTPPEGTRRLCESRPEDARPGPNAYIFGGSESPAIRAFGTPFEASQADSDRVGEFARAALLNQPLDWLDHVVTEDLPRYYSDDRLARDGVGLDYDGLEETLVSGPLAGPNAGFASSYYTTQGQFLNGGRLDAFRSYEGVTRVSGIAFALLALLALAGAVIAPVELRRGALLFGTVALVATLGPLLTLYFDARYAVPAYGPLAAAAAVGGAALSARGRAAAARRGRASR